MFSFSEGNSFNEILERCLARIPDSLDKREGSIIYDALAPACAEMAQLYIALDVYADQTYLINATGDNLDNRVVDYGLTRNPATYALRYGTFTDISNNAMTIDINARFSIPNEYGGYNFKVIQATEIAGKYILQCETAGTVGNEYFGPLLPLESVNNLGSCTLGDIYVAGEDVETDDSLRERAVEKLTEVPFGGNIADYKQFIEDLDGIGGCLVIPAWNGGGTVKLVIITNSYTIPTSTVVNQIQEIVDPTQNQGQGIGKAPIGHVVTVVAPTAYNISVSATLEIESGYTLPTMQSDIETAISNYFKSVQADWSDSTTLSIYRAQIIAAILSIKGVTNVSALLLNNSANDITLNVLTGTNPFPILTEVVLDEGE